MNMKARFTAFAITMAMSCSAAAGLITSWSSNGHEYKLVQGQMTWDQANSSLTDGWYLATITSAEEQSFVSNAFANYLGEFWLGGYQKEDGFTQAERVAGAADNWHWVTGEDFNGFDNWRSGEPNEWRGKLENHLGIWNNGGSWNWHWNDEHGKANIKGYIAERGTYAVPEPSNLALLAIGLIGLTLTRKHIKQ